MEGFNVTTAKSLLGRNVNLHLKDGSVIVNVNLTGLQEDEFKRRTFIRCVPYGRKDALEVPLKSVAWADLLNLNLIPRIR